MAARLSLIQNHLSAVITPESSFLKEPLSFLKLEDLIPADMNMRRKSLRQFLERDVSHTLLEFYEKAEFPLYLLPKLKHLFGIPSGGYDCKKIFATETFLNLYEIGRIDGALAAFFATNSLVLKCIDVLGSEKQKEEFLPKICNLQTLVSWALAEPDVGSHYNSLVTHADTYEGGYVLNGIKKWPVNAAVASYFIVWARPPGKKHLEAFILPADTKGLTIEPGNTKFNNRIIQGGSIRLVNVKIPSSYRLGKCDNVELVTQVVDYSRLLVAMAPIGIISGVFEHVIKYISQNFEDSVSLMSYQMIQEKLFRMLGHFCNSFLINWRLVQMIETEKVSLAQASLVKALITTAGREVVRLGREMMPGNGASIENYVMKALVDMEAYFTLEGTYDICVLVAGKSITGISAFKSSFKQR